MRCGRKWLPRTRDGLCYSCATADPSITKIRFGWSQDGQRELTIAWREGEPFDDRDYATLTRQLAAIPRRPNVPGRPESPSWQEIDKVLEELRRSGRAAAARALRAATKSIRIERAHRLRDQGLSVPMIGIRMGFDDGRGPYPERTIRRWLSAVDTTKG